jgi:glucose/mannose-6-phosphate isomerase
MMNVFIQEFGKQLKTAMDIGKNAQLTNHAHPLQNIVVLGMGGSGIGGDFVAEFVKDSCSVPFVSCKSYQLPAFVGKNSLVIASSFSGNTEETLASFEKAQTTGAKIVCLTSGGKLLAKATEHKLDLVQIPAVKQPPRSCLGYSFVQVLYILQHFGFAPERFESALSNSISTLEQEQAKIQKLARQAAQKMHQKFSIIYATDRMSAVGLRLRQQMNENAKLLACHHSYPEMNHNELVGWREQSGDFVVVNFRSKDDNNRNALRMDVCKNIIAKVSPEIIDIECLGDTLIEQAMYGVHLGDWISWELAQARGVDAVEVNSIDFLKKELAAAALG